MYEDKKNLTFSENQYLNLSNVCDQILRLNLSNPAVIGLDFIHVKRYSTNFGNLYRVLYTKKIDVVFFNIILITKYIFIAFWKIFSSLFVNSYQPQKPMSQVDLLIVSHYITYSESAKFEDSYFGKIINQIDLNKFKVAVIYINHSNRTPFFIKPEKNIKYFLLPPSIDFKSLIKIYLMSFKSLRTFKKLSTSQLSKKLSSRSRIELFSPSTIHSQTIANQVKSYVKALSPRAIITTYEGHAWERLTFYYAREVCKHIKCMAYQHAPIFKHQHAIKRGIGDKYDPDIIFASGAISEKYFLSCNDLMKSKIILLGSGRRMSKSIKKNSSGCAMKACLVVPEGTLYECSILFEFVLQCAHLVKDISFIFRFPPQINIEEFIMHNLNFRRLPKNVLISSSSLDIDISKSEYVLYRGSSAVIHAVLNGLRPIYFMRDNELSMDPLFLYQPNERIVRNADEFLEKIEDRLIKSNYISEYCNKLYSKLNMRNLYENL